MEPSYPGLGQPLIVAIGAMKTLWVGKQFGTCNAKTIDDLLYLRPQEFTWLRL